MEISEEEFAKMKYVLIFILALFLTSCTITRKVIMPDGGVYIVKSQKDDLVVFKKGDVEFTVDGRGRPGMIEQALGIMFMNLPQVEVTKN